LLPDVRVCVVLGKFAYDAVARVVGLRRRPAFGHLVEVPAMVGERQLVVLGSFHPSQQNTFTGKLTEPQFDAVFARARQLGG
jgi:uracil-DNA glycosylase